MMSRDLFCGDLVRKYGSPADMPIWVLMELFSFGSIIDLYLYCAERWGNEEMRHEHYMLRQAKSVRNACAHSSDMLNGIAVVDTTVGTDSAVLSALAPSRHLASSQNGQDEESPHQADCNAHVPSHETRA